MATGMGGNIQRAVPARSLSAVAGREGRGWRIAALAVFSTTLAIRLAAHQPWRDELQAWAIVRASDTLPDLLANLRYEGHPILWYAVLWPLARVTGNPVAMQAASLFIASASAWLILTRAPFALWARTAIIFSYFAFFEYAVLARSYGLGMLLTVASCSALSPSARRPRWQIGLLLGLLALTSVYGLFLSGAFIVYITMDARGHRREEKAPTRSYVAGGALWLVCALVSIRMIIPPADAPYGGGLQGTRGEGIAAWANVWRAMVPLQSRLGVSFWETNTSELVPRGGLLAIAASVGLVVLVLLRVRRSLPATLAWILGLAVLQGFAVLRIAGGLRHAGTIALLALAVMWLAEIEPQDRRQPWGGKWAIRLDQVVPGRLVDVALAATLVASVAAGLIASVNDLRFPFSGARAAAESIRRADLDSAFIIGVPDVQAAGVAAYLDRPIFYPTADRYGTYVRWDAQRRRPPTSIADSAVEIARKRDETVVLVTSAPLVPRSGIRLLSEHSGTITEDIWVYVVTG